MNNYDNETDEMKPDNKIKVVYIGGIEHCGSTFLGVILDQHPSLICVGELSLTPEVGWAGNSNDSCSCGKYITECGFWNNVKIFREGHSLFDNKSLIRIMNRFDRNLALPKVILNRLIRTRKFSDYLTSNEELFYSISKTSRKSGVVDTSKRVSRGMALSLSKQIDLRVIHLVRDSRAVAFSSGNEKRKIKVKWWVSAIRWSLINLALMSIKNIFGKDRLMLVKYEDLLSNPLDIISSIGKFVDIDLNSIAQKVSNKELLRIRHLAVGNIFLEKTNQIRINTQENWRDKMPVSQQRKVWFLTKPIMLMLNYKK